MRTTIPKPTDRDEWLAARRPYVGASEAACLVGEHPFITAAELAAEKLGGGVERDSTAMRRGRALEAGIASWWEEENHVALIEPELLFIFDDALIATLDRRVVGAQVGVEIKTSNHYVDEIERHWYWQCQCQMLCADLDRVEVIALDPSMTLKHFVVTPDDEDQALIAEAARKFCEHIRRGEIPPDASLSYRAVQALHPAPTIESVELSDETLGWCLSLGALQARIRDLEADADELKAMVCLRLGAAAEGHHDGRTVVTWRATTRTTVDAKRLRAEHPDIAQECTTSTTYRQLRMVNP
jgi:putative phage-type endonuclease